MKVILLKDVSKVGQQGTIKEISDGFALNKLIPQGLAVQATPEKIAAHEKMRKETEAAHAKELEALVAKIQSFEGKKAEIKTRATEKGGLFKSLAAKDIVQALGGAIPLEVVQLEKPIKEVGDHSVVLVAGSARAHVTISVKAA